MKLATYDDGSRDGQLVVVSRDLSQAHYASGIASRLQSVLDDWNFLAPQLEDLSTRLNGGRARHAFAFDPARCRAPLPRAHHWRVATAGGLHCWPGDWARPCLAHVSLHQGAQQALPCLGVAAISGDVTVATPGREAIEAVRLLMLTQTWAAPAGDADEPLLLVSAPVVVTPDELAGGWRGGRLMMTAPSGGGEDTVNGEAMTRLACHVRLDGRRAPGREAALPRQWPNEGHLGDLIAAAAQHHPLNSGAVLMWPCPQPEEPQPVPAGRRLRAEVFGPGGFSVFGAIEQVVGVAPDQPEEQPSPQAALEIDEPPADGA